MIHFYYYYYLIMPSVSCPSMQSFFQPEVKQPQKPVINHGPANLGDGFTQAEIEETLDPLKRAFDPHREYEECDIADLVAGPLPVTFMGRIVNFTTTIGKSKNEKAAKGWHHVIVKDDTAAICVSPLISSKMSSTCSL